MLPPTTVTIMLVFTGIFLFNTSPVLFLLLWLQSLMVILLNQCMIMSRRKGFWSADETIMKHCVMQAYNPFMMLSNDQSDIQLMLSEPQWSNRGFGVLVNSPWRCFIDKPLQDLNLRPFGSLTPKGWPTLRFFKILSDNGFIPMTKTHTTLE